MRLIKYGLLAFGLALIAACGKPQEPATETAPATTTAAPAPETAAPAADSAATPAPAADNALKPESSATAAACPTGCVYMNCPPPNGMAQCCTKTSTGYKACS